MKKRLEAKITGRVQLVMFRDFVERNAKKLRLVGFVRNKEDDSVEVVAEGEEEALRDLEQKLWKGAVLSRVEKVDTQYSEAKSEFRYFEIRYD